MIKDIIIHLVGEAAKGPAIGKGPESALAALGRCMERE